VIAVVFGTTGELIKLAPLLRELEARGQRALVLCTAQQVQQIPAFLADLELPEPDLWLARGHHGRDLERKQEVAGWGAAIAASLAREGRRLARRLRADGRPPVVLVHGDTMTTVLGALVGRVLRARVGHVEAGLRSGDWRDPFPEELNRRAAARLADLHFAPGAAAVANLRRERVRGAIVDTRENTIADALALAGAAPVGVPVPDEPFGLVSLHRFELIERPERFAEVLEVLREHSRRQPLLFIYHSVTAKAIEAAGLGRFFDARFRRVPRQRYTPFIALLKASRFLVTDSGGSQEECALLGHPCLVHRARTERDEGLRGGSVILSGMDTAVLRAFLADPERLRTFPPAPAVRPTERILAELERIGALAPAPAPAHA